MITDPIRTVIWGQPGVGKTTLASKFPNPWFIDVEKSTAWMPELKGRQWERPKTWDQILDQIERFKRELPGETLVIDSIDWMESKYIEKFGSPGGQSDYGKSYNDMDKLFRKVLDSLTEISEMGVHIVLTAHFDTKEVTDPDQMSAYSKYVLKMQKKTCSAVMEWADEILFLRFRDVIITDNKGKKGKAVGGQIRDIKTVRAASYDAKNRFDLPAEIEFKEDKELPEPLKTLLWSGFDAYLNLKNGENPQVKPQVQPAITPQVRPQVQPQPTPKPQPIQELSIDEPYGIVDDDQSWKQGVRPDLVKKMEETQVTEMAMRMLVKEKSWLPGDPNLSQYPDDFINFLLGSWDKIIEFMQAHDIDGLPF